MNGGREHAVRAMCGGEDPGVGGADDAAAFTPAQTADRSYREDRAAGTQAQRR